ncbi:MAG: UvrD-helicase domain-containing protein, partial [Firmicutes bacterium]|nr:UvrD-helicase domain-containing protein [Bacillota bacterium]
MANQWTQEQLAAIETNGCNLLVSAAAGAGKTAVLVERIIGFVCQLEQPLDIDKLLVVTFTEAAAAEMRERIGAALENEIATSKRVELAKQLSLLNGASISTLHSFCLEVIHRYFYLLELDPSFRVADELEATMLRQEILEDVLEQSFADEEDAFLALAARYGGKTSDEGLARLILQLYRYCWSNPWPQQWLEEAASSFVLAEGEDAEDVLQPWLSPLRAELRLTLEQADASLQEAIVLCGLPNAPIVYEPVLEKELSQVQRLLALLDDSWQTLRQAWLGIAFDRLPAAKDVDETIKERIKGLRDLGKNLLNKSGTTYFTRSTQEYVEEIEALAPLMNALVTVVNQFANRYAHAKKEAGLLDFNDLEHFCLRILL